ncbi:MAG: hypothetical protein LBQ00_03890 [Syntrophobacterales bacterium]|jgi:hypothetical protein|nr:hypothetical protein [Syntrophobacterales bacterium]
MALIDDLKKKAEEGLKTLKETAQDFAFNVEKQATIGKKKYVDISKLQRGVQSLLAEIGEYVYDEITSGRSLTKDDPYVTERINQITAMKSEIDTIENEISEIQHKQSPKRKSE